MKKTTILFDTDIGTDADDALALAFIAIHSPQSLFGITTTNGPVHIRAKVAGTLLDTIGQPNIPVFQGIRSPLSSQAFIFTSGKEKEGINPQRLTEKLETGVQALKKSKHKVRIVSTAPLSTIAHLLSKDRIGLHVREIFLMGGSSGLHGLPKLEHNFAADPKAAQIVIGSGIPVFVIPLDQTAKHTLNNNELSQFRNSTTITGKLLWRWMQNWMETTKHFGDEDLVFKEKIFLHDPITILATIHPKLFKWKKIKCHVSDSGIISQKGSDIIHLCIKTPKDIKKRILSVLSTCL